MTKLEENKEIINKNIRVDAMLLREALENKHVNELSFFYFLKLNFVNSRIYKVKDPLGRVAELSGYSKRTIFRRFQALRNLGLLSEDKGAYVLKGTPRDSRVKLKLHSNITAKEIKDLLNLEAVKIAAREQGKYQNIKNWIENGQRYQPKRKADDPYNPLLSFRYLGRLLNVSAAAAFILVQRWENSGLIEREKPTPKFVMRCDPEAVKFLENNHGHRYMAGKIEMFEMAPQRVSFRDQVTVAPITKRRWQKYRKDQKIRDFVNNLNREQCLKTA